MTALAAVIVLLVAAVAAVRVWIDSSNGRASIARLLSDFELENGLRFQIDRIDGSILGSMKLVGVSINDLNGPFATLPEVSIQWDPRSYFQGEISVDHLTAREMRLLRLPKLRGLPSPGEPLLPDLDVSLGRVQIDRISIDKGTLAHPLELSFAGKAKIDSGKVWIEAGFSGQSGDKLDFNIRAVPDANQFDLALELRSPAYGAIAALTGVSENTFAKLDGKGTWQRWEGGLTSKIGNSNFAELTLAGRKGQFRVNGFLGPAIVAKFLRQKETPRSRATLDLVGRLERRALALQGSIASNGLSATTAGTLDFGRGAFSDLKVGFRIDDPGLFLADASGRGLQGKIAVDGDFAAPSVAYNIAAKRLGWRQFELIGLQAVGRIRPAPDSMKISLKATVNPTSGIGGGTDEILARARLSGTFNYAAKRLVTRDITLSSDRLTATGRIAANLQSGNVAASISGGLDGYRLESIGVFDVGASVDFDTDRPAGQSMSGLLRARSTMLESDGLRSFLGGQFLARASVGLLRDRQVQITSARLIAPKLRIEQASGVIGPLDGSIRLGGRGNAANFGLVNFSIGGSIEKPFVNVSAPRPGMGFGLAELEARVEKGKAGYVVAARGQTDYGPISANFEVMNDKQVLLVDVVRASLGGILASGKVRQTAAGPFDGSLRAQGAGFEGTVDLSAEGKVQRARLAATARDAELRGSRSITIGSGLIKADILLAARPIVIADIQLSDSQWDRINIATAWARIEYRDGKGSARGLVEGRQPVPFRIAANALLEPQLWRLGLAGKVNGAEFASLEPIRIVPQTKGYRLSSASLRLGEGEVRLEGQYDDSLNFRADLENLDLALVNPFVNGLDLGGSLAGSIEWQQVSFANLPAAQGIFKIRNFRRGAFGQDGFQGIDLDIATRMRPGEGAAGVLVKVRERTIGQAKLVIAPEIANNKPLLERVFAAPLSGGIRYDGPADLLFALAALPNQSLAGRVGVAADFSGSVAAPQLKGSVVANDLSYDSLSYGTRLSRIRVRGDFSNDQLLVREFSARAGAGVVRGGGTINLSLAKGFPAQLSLDLDQAELARTEAITTAASGNLQLANAPGTGALVSGTLRLPETRFQFVRASSADIITLTGIRRRSVSRSVIGVTGKSGEANQIATLPANLSLNLKLLAPSKLYVSGMGLESEWKAELRVTGTSSNPQFAGDLELVRGTLDFAGRSFALETGRISFKGGNAYDPNLRIVAASQFDGAVIRLEIQGTGQNPLVSFTSRPALPQDEIIARILFGQSISELSAIQAIQLAASLNRLRAAPGGINPLGALQSASGLDRLRILSADQTNGRGTAIALGHYITDDVFVEVITDARGYTASQIEITLSPALSLLSHVNSQGTSNAALKIRKDY